ncbi:hypothetical protein GP486_005905 [Trichoglossum hirsutum]|uniref:Chromatin remodeling complex subunit n=1 Tax=Trichoglossum hirsutum TaxID=265104 RepID=A0A9P8L8E5_9PEZI|nr:hypothetical protein GP486_005905 [Trichoglossum hirsutum]
MHSSDSVKSPREPELSLGEELGSGLFVTDGEPSSPSPLPSPEPEPPLQVRRAASEKPRIEITVPPLVQKSAYMVFQDEWKVKRILEELGPGVRGELRYDVEFADGHTAIFTFTRLLELSNGDSALASFDGFPVQRHESRKNLSHRPRFANSVEQLSDGSDMDDELTILHNHHSTRTIRDMLLRSSRLESTTASSHSEMASRDTSSNASEMRRSGRLRVTRSAGTSTFRQLGYRKAARSPNFDSDLGEYEVNGQEESDQEDFAEVYSDIIGPPKKRKRKSTQHRASGGAKRRIVKSSRDLSPSAVGVRRSGRTTKLVKNMKERGEDEIWADEDSDVGPPKAVGAREVFRPLPRNSQFRLRHRLQCDACGDRGDNAQKGILVYCQGCTMAYHRACLGSRSGRDHLVTKIGDGDFALQCRRCIGAVKKEATAPRLDRCQVCKTAGPACAAFRERMTAKQEEKEREENGGEDPITRVDSNLINNSHNVLFRCCYCMRAFHFSHLPPRADDHDADSGGEGSNAEQRFREYSHDWACVECTNKPGKIQALVAWRPVDEDRYDAGNTVEMVGEDEKEYLVKWEHQSYFKCQWMPGPWTWGVTTRVMRKAFAKKNNGQNLPIMKAEDAIPEDYLRVDIVLDVKYTSYVSVRAEQIDKARIKEVERAFVKYKGLGYEEAVWEEPPSPEDGERWTDFVAAYEDWVMASYVHLPKSRPMEKRIEKVRSMDFESDLMKKAQPSILTGGEMMSYQMEGLNWLYYKWHKGHSAILADEMGLGKTIQIIALLATLVEDHQVWPFLIVVPNSTCPNWRREIKKWCPTLRVVTFFGSAHARDCAMKYELLPGKDKDLRCHIVVTSYETASDDSCNRVFKSINWAGLIVDEGQRLKNDKNLLYEALRSLDFSFKILLTGTPLQNNTRELFNLLQFLDKNIDASHLDMEYAQLTKENVPKLHDLIRPFFLRRTKAQVLTFLPPMAEIIVPVTMSLVQKKLYQSILAKNPDLIKSILGREAAALSRTDRSNLSNILMQLRKCLSHPFIYNSAIEERTHNPVVSHRNLVEAGSKLQLLEIMLPKLHERGHRVLIFSQFLDMLTVVEDFLDGLGLNFGRLDGSMGALEKQKRIDAFNAPDSAIFAFLLSTRAGGVGINLATADTVIILDPDFNPHQDIQALSRAHRIGQKKKVLVFHLMTRNTAEERIMQIGKKKMSLDHAIINTMGEDEAEEVDVESILKFGASAIFEDSTEGDIRYDSASVDLLLDRSQAEDTKSGEDKSAETQFSFARVWANEHGRLEDGLQDSEPDQPDPTIWDKILKQREKEAAKEAAAKREALGRGKRKRRAVDYSNSMNSMEIDGVKSPPFAKAQEDRSSDTDFEVKADSDDEDYSDENGASLENMAPDEKKFMQDLGWGVDIAPFKRAPLPVLNVDAGPTFPGQEKCAMCDTFHEVGSCPLKLCGVEHCGLCGRAHFSGANECPHLNSETQVRLMLIALKDSTEDKELVDAATAYLRGRKGTLVRKKKERTAKAEKIAAMVRAGNAGETSMPATAEGANTGPFTAINGVGDGNTVAAGGLYQTAPPITSAVPGIANGSHAMDLD